MMFIAVLTAVAVLVLTAVIYWILTSLQSSDRFHLEKALFKYDNFLLLNTAQHKLIFEALKVPRVYQQLPCCLLPVGGMFEGFHIVEFPCDGQVAQEMDFMLVLPGVTADEGCNEALQLVSVQGPNPGYVNLKVLDATCIKLQDIPLLQEHGDPFTMFYEEHKGELFLSHRFVKVFERRVVHAVSITVGRKFHTGIDLGIKRKSVEDFYPVMTILFKEPVRCLIWPDPTEVWPDSAIGALFWLSEIQGTQLNSWQNQVVDIAPAVKCNVPTHIKDAWLNRTRHWPNRNLVEKISTLPCYLLAKPHPFTQHKSLEWRFSFCSAELLLSSAVRPWEKQCTMVLKALRKKYLQHPKLISSYHIKTILYRVLETTPSHKRVSMNRSCLLKRLLEELINCVQQKSLPDFFIPESNMFRHYNDADLKNVLLKLQDMKKNLLKYLTEDLFAAAVTEERGEQEFEGTYWGVI